MKEIEINKNSLHYRFIKRMDFMYKYSYNDTCEYSLGFIRSCMTCVGLVFLLAIAFACVVGSSGVVAFLVLTLLSHVTGSVFFTSLLAAEGVLTQIFVFFIGFVTLANLIWLAAVTWFMIIKFSNERAKTEKTPSAVKQVYSALKDKTCVKIKIT